MVICFASIWKISRTHVVVLVFSTRADLSHWVVCEVGTACSFVHGQWGASEPYGLSVVLSGPDRYEYSFGIFWE